MQVILGLVTAWDNAGPNNVALSQHMQRTLACTAIRSTVKLPNIVSQPYIHRQRQRFVSMTEAGAYDWMEMELLGSHPIK
jgi:hypothetical protein